MAKTAPRTILLKGRGIRMERVAGGAITPGHICMLNSSDQLVVNTRSRSAGAPLIVAVEAEHLGNPGQASGDIDTAYAQNDYVQAEILSPGCEVNALVAASAAAIAVGDLIELSGDGTVRKLTSLTDNSGGTANTTLQDIGSSFTEAEVANNFADLAAWLNNGHASARAIALDAVDNSSNGDSTARIRIMII